MFAPNQLTLVTTAPPKSAPLKFEFSKRALSRVADLKLTPVKSKPSKDVFDKSILLKSAPDKSATTEKSKPPLKCT